MPALSVCERANYQSLHWQPIRANPANIDSHSPRWAVCGENNQRRWLPQWALLLWSPSPCWSRKSRGSKEEVVFVIEPSVGFLTNDACCTPYILCLGQENDPAEAIVAYPCSWPALHNQHHLHRRLRTNLWWCFPPHSSCGPQPEAVLPPCEALQRMRSSTSLSLRNSQSCL